jgi:hypothetical protein
VALSSPIKLWDSDKLRILQRLDKHRQWRSLDEKRYCLVCGKLITGRDIEVIGGLGTETLRIVCPTRDCHSIPMDWVLPTDEVLSHTARSTETQSPVTTHFELRQEKAIAARMRKWTMRFKGAGK